MISIKADLHGIEESVIRPVLVTTVNDVKKLLGISKDVYTKYDVRDNLQKRKTNTGLVIGDNTTYEDRIDIEYEEETEEGTELTLYPTRPDTKPIYIDQDVNSSIVPVYHSRTINVRFKYSNKSKSKVFAIANKLKLYNSSDSMYCLHDFEYHYMLPNFINKLLIEINNKKNYRLTEKLVLEQYIDETFDERLDYANTLDGDLDKSNLVIRERQLDIEGYITDDLQSLKPEYDDSESLWYLEFAYNFTFEKPVALIVKYPIMIYNSVIDKYFRSFINQKEKKDNRDLRTGRAQSMYTAIDREQDYDSPVAIKPGHYYLVIPEYDTERLPKPSTRHARIMSVLTQVDDVDRTLLFNINDIPHVKFKETYVDFLLNSEAKYIANEFQSLFYIELWKNDKKDYQNKVILESDGTLRSTYELDYKYMYRVVFNIITDLSMLTIYGMDRLRAYYRQQLEQPKTQMKTLKDYHKYWEHVNYMKFKNAVENDNLITDWLSLMNVHPNYLTDAIRNSSKYFDMAFRLMNKGRVLRTVQISSVLTCMLEPKE